MQPRLGALLGGKWRLARVLGVGGHASVYEAVHRNGRRVAIKVLHPELADAPVTGVRTRQRFLHEARVANRIRHEGVVAIHDDGELADGTPFLVMELLAGETLAERSERSGRPFSCEQALWVGDRLLDVLAEAHRAGVVHCDVKPGNVFVTERAQLKLLDFGTASSRELALAAGGAPVLPLGTPGFLAPEQAREHRAGIGDHTDVWGVGATLFALLTGRAVHDADTPAAAIAAAQTPHAPAFHDRIARLDARCAELLRRALAFEPSERWSSARAMRDALHAALPRVPAGAPFEPHAVHGLAASFDTVG